MTVVRVRAISLVPCIYDVLLAEIALSEPKRRRSGSAPPPAPRFPTHGSRRFPRIARVSAAAPNPREISRPGPERRGQIGQACPVGPTPRPAMLQRLIGPRPGEGGRGGSLALALALALRFRTVVVGAYR